MTTVHQLFSTPVYQSVHQLTGHGGKQEGGLSVAGGGRGAGEDEETYAKWMTGAAQQSIIQAFQVCAVQPESGQNGTPSYRRLQIAWCMNYILVRLALHCEGGQ